MNDNSIQNMLFMWYYSYRKTLLVLHLRVFYLNIEHKTHYTYTIQIIFHTSTR